MILKPWREVAVPHADVLKGTFLQSDFAADITAVQTGKAPPVYQDAAAFFECTYITEGMRLLLTQVAQRISGKGGEPVIQLQTAFGGGKTHTMLAVYHLATRTCPLADLAGVPTLVERAGLMDVPRANVAVLDGAALAPGQPWKHGRTAVKTLWGELAWQLGKADGLAMVKESDATGTSPGKEVLRNLLEAYAPCVVLMDELAVYVRQFPEGVALSGGTYDSNLSFVQSLTEAAKLVPTAVVLASLPDSNQASSGDRGPRAIAAIEHIFGRVQALWRPVGTEEAFEIVRRRLFEPVRDPAARDAVCRAFADAYAAEGSRLPSETLEGHYLDRLTQAYPIHPEVFDRLYEDWTTLEGFQRTRGVLKLMAKVIARLWKDNNQELMILPGSLPLTDSGVRDDLTYLLGHGWEPVIEGDIDGDRAEATQLEAREPRLGQVAAARRVARTLFLGTAPSSVAVKPGLRGLDRGRVLLGCLQPGQASALYADALGRLADRLHYLNSTGDKASDATRYWFDTRANLRREMEDRKRRFDDATDVRRRIEAAAKNLFVNATLFDGVHPFTPHADVPDDGGLRLVVLPPEQWHAKESPAHASAAVLEYLRSHGSQPRHRANRLLFAAPDQAVLGRLKEATRVALAWASIVEAGAARELTLDLNQLEQARKELAAANDVVPRAARECFKWLLCPEQDDPAGPPVVKAYPVNTVGGTAGGELERVCRENTLVVEAWSPIFVRAELRSYYWTNGATSVGVGKFWEDTQRYVYLPRLKNRGVLAAAVRAGGSSRDFFGTACGQSGGGYEGFQFGEGEVPVDDTLLLIEPEEAKRYAIQVKKIVVVAPPEAGRRDKPTASDVAVTDGNGASVEPGHGQPQPAARPKSFRGTVDVPAGTAKFKLVQIADEIVTLLAGDVGATVRVTVDVVADFPAGVSDGTKRSVSENAATLGFKAKDWE